MELTNQKGYLYSNIYLIKGGEVMRFIKYLKLLKERKILIEENLRLYREVDDLNEYVIELVKKNKDLRKKLKEVKE